MRIYLPLLLALMIVVGIFIGSRLSPVKTKTTFLASNSPNINKLNAILNYIEEEYVDTISRKELTDRAINALLEHLDPHSAYIPSEDLETVNQPLMGNFDGIGVEFNLLRDTVIVVSVISGGPSDLVGIKPGDRIIKAGNKSIAGVKIKQEEVLKTLRGKSNTRVIVTVLRKGVNKPLEFTITRGKIPIYSVDAAFMVDRSIGYIKINKFSATTYDEFVKAFDGLLKANMQSLILDLRNNPGGFLTGAISIADEFLEDGKLITYTEGKARPKHVYKATFKGKLEQKELVILIDEGSASASEILAGAIQDNDRGIIIGRRSYGKGLVQEQVELPDGSAMRLTIARYYTPTGRSIQRPYSEGREQYMADELQRVERGEQFHVDSISLADSLKFKTPKGKTVYGGGGIMPDIFIPVDSAGYTTYFSHLMFTGIIQQFALDFADNNRNKLKSYVSVDEFSNQFIVGNEVIEALVTYAEKQGMQRNNSELNRSADLIRKELKAYIARNIFGNQGYYKVNLLNDKAFDAAIDVLKNNRSIN